MLRSHSVLILTVAITGVLCSQPLCAEIFRWVDEYGQVHYSDKVPPEYSQLERKIFNQKGRLTTTIKSAKTQIELETERQRAKLEEKKRKEIQEKKNRDLVLLRMFTSIEEMESTRDERIALFDSRIAILDKKLKKLRQEHSELESNLGMSDTMGAAQIELIRRHQQELANRIESIEEQRRLELNSKTKTEARFVADIERFLDLTRERDQRK